MMFHMKQILVQLDDTTAKLLEQIAPGRGRKRSQFVREALIKAIMEVAEEHTRRAYERQPDDEDWWFDPEAWAPESEAIHPSPELQRELDREAARRKKKQGSTKPTKSKPNRTKRR
jgi:predicted transcriptional regulator